MKRYFTVPHVALIGACLVPLSACTGVKDLSLKTVAEQATPAPSQASQINSPTSGASPTPSQPASVPLSVTTFAGKADVEGHADGTGTAAIFTHPACLACDASGNLLVSDVGDYTIRKITPSGVVTTFAGQTRVQGHADGTGTGATFNDPQGLACDASGNLFVTDAGNQTIRKITQAGVVTTFIESSATFTSPEGLACDASGNLFVADAGNQTILKITQAGVVTTFAGKVGVVGYADGPGSAAIFHFPDGLAFDASGNLLVADAGNNVIRKISPGGVVTTFAGQAGVWGHADGPLTTATFNSPYGLVFDASGNLFAADEMGQTIRKIR